MKQRLVFLDVLRIAAILAIVAFHVGIALWSLPALNGWLDLRLGPVAVYVMLFVSGAALAVSHPVVADTGSFLYRRAARIYPAFWLALGLAFMVEWQSVLASKPVDILISITGLSGAVGQWSGVPGGTMRYTFWFIGLILCMYAAYPVVARAMQDSPHLAMIAFAAISLASMSLVATILKSPVYNIRWFPLCGLVWFALGVYVIRTGWYPKAAHSSVWLAKASEATFYVFLLHITPPFTWIMGYSLPLWAVSVVIASLALTEAEVWLRAEMKNRVSRQAECLPNTIL